MRQFLSEAKKKIIVIASKLAIASTVAAIILVSLSETYGWFSFNRSTMHVAKIENPTAINITAGNQENYTCIDLSGLDLTNPTLYKDYVFGVNGLNVPSYRLQLSYTTNIQLRYELYHARVGNNPPVGSSIVVYPHTSDGGSTTYYIESSDIAITGRFLNKKTLQFNPREVTSETFARERSGLYTKTSQSAGTYVSGTFYYKLDDGDYVIDNTITYDNFDANKASLYTFTNIANNATFDDEENYYVENEILANPSGTYYGRTYSTYTYTNKYAVPLYWQSGTTVDDKIEPTNVVDNSFYDYYILRVRWSETRVNNKETDIIYISARNES